MKVAALNDRVVYAPHIYGPDVFDMDYFKDLRFPNNVFEVGTMAGWNRQGKEEAGLIESDLH